MSGNEQRGYWFEKIVHVLVVEGERLARRIRIVAHPEEWQRRYEVAFGGVEVHVLLIAVSGEEVIAHPALGQRRQMYRIEGEANLVAGSKHDQLVVQRCQQGQHVAVARVGSRRTRVGPGRARLFIDVLHIAWRRAFDLQGKSVET